MRWERVDRMLALVSVSPTSCQDRRILIESSRDGWWYSALLPTGELLLSYFTDPDLLQHGRHDLRPYLPFGSFTAERAGTCRLETPSIHSAPSMLRTKLKGHAWLSAGDSASTFDPISGQGIYKALLGAERAAQAVIAALEGDSSPMVAYERAYAGSSATTSISGGTIIDPNHDGGPSHSGRDEQHSPNPDSSALADTFWHYRSQFTRQVTLLPKTSAKVSTAGDAGPAL